ncbi:hypothetical protein [Mycolicibacterium sphagni]|uniref:hypothetical protein n=1 Tax=Mycolicibacterium sphagni TaxID=1786 RepID=UPI0010550E24|nr:hypothetical protein [Mycolicibacterium sphagni]
MYGTVVLATAITAGIVGDSMTVLNRHDHSVRAALQNWLVLISTVCAIAGCVVTWATGFADVRAALAFGAAMFFFLIEDTLRRLLMATLMFWRIIAIDLASLVAMVAVLIFAPKVTMTWLFLALTAGQASAIAVGACILPQSERWLARPFPAKHGTVVAYGSWRSLQQAVFPSLLALTRVVVIGILGLAAAGQLEAARIYSAPALLPVMGIGGFMFASYALARAEPMHSALRSADKGTLALVLGIVILSICAVIAIPLIGPLMTGQHISALTVIGWLLFTLGVAAFTPYASLAAVRGMQATVLVVSVAHSLLSLALAAVLAYVVGSVEWVPFGLAIGSFAGVLAMRGYILRPKRYSDRQADAKVTLS